MKIQHLWLEFRIYLPALAAYIESFGEPFDGIFADKIGFILGVEDSDNNKGLLQRYLDSLTKEGEEAKFNYPALVNDSVLSYKALLLDKKYSDLGPIDRKLLLGLPLTDEEISTIVAVVRAS